jgi:hypothetical protein
MRHTSAQIIVIVAAVAFLAGSVLTFAVMQWTRRITASATVKTIGIGVYQDPECTVPVTEIAWGMVEPGEEKNISVYIKNESNVPVTLTMHTEDWSPANASLFIHFSWDYDGEEIPLDGSKPVILVLTVDLDISGVESFAFTIVIVGSG